MSRVLWTPESRCDIKDIARYLAHEQHRRQAAQRFVQELDRKSRLYATQPLMGTARPELGEEYRCFTHQRWVVIYRPLDDGILILRVVDGARDFGGIFGLPSAPTPSD
jgi:toxin ParE1/3/4